MRKASGSLNELKKRLTVMVLLFFMSSPDGGVAKESEALEEAVNLRKLHTWRMQNKTKPNQKLNQSALDKSTQNYHDSVRGVL